MFLVTNIYQKLYLDENDVCFAFGQFVHFLRSLYVLEITPYFQKCTTS